MNRQDRMAKARAVLLVGAPFYGSLAMGLPLTEDSGIDTMATDGKAIYYNPDFVDSLDDKTIRGIMAHEVLHCVYAHHARRKHRDPELWNQACDYAINPDLIADGFTLPDDALNDPNYWGMPAEQIYADLERDQDKADAGQGAASFGEVLDGSRMDGDRLISETEHVARESDEWSQRAAMAAAVGERAGTSSQAGNRFKATLRSSVTAWQDVLREHVDQVSGRDTSWSRPNRRYISSGLYMPGPAIATLGHLVAAVDISGSISEELYAEFLVELQSIMDSGMVHRLTVLYINRAIQDVREYQAGDILHTEVNAGGGTSFAPAMAYAQDNDAALLVYFTDLQCPLHDFGMDPGCPVIWAHYGGKGTTPPFGTVAEFVA